MTPAKKSAPVHPPAVLAFMLAIVAAGFSLYGSFLSERQIADSPLNRLRGSSGMGSGGSWVPLAAFAVPLGLGLAAAIMGGKTLNAIERQSGAFTGSGAAVFAIMIGGLSAVIAACMLFAVYGWQYVPTIYTQ